jgi:hypothetical protein
MPIFFIYEWVKIKPPAYMIFYQQTLLAIVLSDTETGSSTIIKNPINIAMPLCAERYQL